jgi:hypothetical protein
MEQERTIPLAIGRSRRSALANSAHERLVGLERAVDPAAALPGEILRRATTDRNQQKRLSSTTVTRGSDAKRPSRSPERRPRLGAPRRSARWRRVAFLPRHGLVHLPNPLLALPAHEPCAAALAALQHSLGGAEKHNADLLAAACSTEKRWSRISDTPTCSRLDTPLHANPPVGLRSVFHGSTPTQSTEHSN